MPQTTARALAHYSAMASEATASAPIWHVTVFANSGPTVYRCRDHWSKFYLCLVAAGHGLSYSVERVQ